MDFTLDTEQDPDERWLAEALQLPGESGDGASPEAALAKALVLRLRVLADRPRHGEAQALSIHITPAAASELGSDGESKWE